MTHNKKIERIPLNFKTRENYYSVIEFDGGRYDIELFETGRHIKTINVDSNYMENKLKNNGELIIK